MGNHLDNQHIHLVFLLFFCNGDFLVRLKATREEGLNHTYLTTIDNTEGETDHKEKEIAENDHFHWWSWFLGKKDEDGETDNDVEHSSNYTFTHTDNLENTNMSIIPVGVDTKVDEDDVQNRNKQPKQNHKNCCNFQVSGIVSITNW